MKKMLSFFFVMKALLGFAQIDFLPRESYELGSRMESVTTGDVNNDGLTDAIFASVHSFDPQNDFHIFVFLQNEDGSLQTPVSYLYPESYGSFTVIRAADVNNDELTDVVIGFGSKLGVFFQNANGTLNEIVYFDSGTTVDGIATGDLNNDGLTDIAACHWQEDYIKVFYQPFDGSFITETYSVEDGGWDEINIGDMNSDNLEDIVFMPGTGSEGSLIVFYQDSTLVT